jgi:hypothetical protein
MEDAEGDDDDDRPSFGKYGVIKKEDFHKKQRSFEVWMEEVKKVPSFSGPKWELQEYYKEYMEDYNTATFPHKKYYDYDKWEMEEYEKQKRSTAAAANVSNEGVHLRELHEAAKRKKDAELGLVRTLMNKEKIEEMKRKQQLQSEMAHAFKTGDRATYLRIKKRLEPEK